MTNKAFMRLSDEEKRTKFRVMVRRRTDDCLTAEELRNLMLAVLPDRQYTLSVYDEPDEFCRVLEIKSNTQGRILFGQALLGFENKPGTLFRTDQAAAAMMRIYKTGRQAHAIHIYIPQTRKGACHNESERHPKENGL
jgi:hypothetical protein